MKPLFLRSGSLAGSFEALGTGPGFRKTLTGKSFPVDTSANETVAMVKAVSLEVSSKSEGV